MREKHIKIMVIKQLKKQFPHWKRLTRKEKKTLATIEVGQHKKVRIYAELDADCGTRRQKQDKSAYFVGYLLGYF